MEMTANYKQLAEELYDVLKRLKNLMDDANGSPINRYGVSMSLADKVIQKYEQSINRVER
jgi:hypothetical protein